MTRFARHWALLVGVLVAFARPGEAQNGPLAEPYIQTLSGMDSRYQALLWTGPARGLGSFTSMYDPFPTTTWARLGAYDPFPRPLLPGTGSYDPFPRASLVGTGTYDPFPRYTLQQPGSGTFVVPGLTLPASTELGGPYPGVNLNLLRQGTATYSGAIGAANDFTSLGAGTLQLAQLWSSYGGLAFLEGVRTTDLLEGAEWVSGGLDRLELAGYAAQDAVEFANGALTFANSKLAPAWLGWAAAQQAPYLGPAAQSLYISLTSGNPHFTIDEIQYDLDAFAGVTAWGATLGVTRGNFKAANAVSQGSMSLASVARTALYSPMAYLAKDWVRNQMEQDYRDQLQRTPGLFMEQMFKPSELRQAGFNDTRIWQNDLSSMRWQLQQLELPVSLRAPTFYPGVGYANSFWYP